MKYKAGDRVKIKSLNWYNENKSKRGNISFPCEAEVAFTSEMSSFCGQIVTISQKAYTQDIGFYRIREDNGIHIWIDEMIEGLVEQETKPNIIEQAKTYWDSIKDAWICPDGYIFKDENGNVINAQKIVLEKRNKYPNTYEACCKVLGIDPDNYLSIRNAHRNDGDEELTDYEGDLLYKLDSLWELIICRDAYWKIAGDEMGLGKPWNPNWTSFEGYPAIYMYRYQITLGVAKHEQHCFSFPTPEMRDAFYENFTKEIEECKELLYYDLD